MTSLQSKDTRKASKHHMNSSRRSTERAKKKMQRQQEATANPIQKPEKTRDSNNIARCKNAQEKHNANHQKKKLQKVMKEAVAILGTAPRKDDARKKDRLMHTRKTHVASNANQMSRAKRRPMEECTAREQQESNRCKEEKQHDEMTEQAACKIVKATTQEADQVQAHGDSSSSWKWLTATLETNGKRSLRASEISGNRKQAMKKKHIKKTSDEERHACGTVHRGKTAKCEASKMLRNEQRQI